MEILFLGTGAGLPSRNRNVSSLALKLLDELNEIWLFDCGESTQHQIIKTNIKPRKITKIFITHLHGDHIFGLPGFLSSRSFQIAEDEKITLYGPPGIKAFIESSLKYSKSNLLYELEINELNPEGGILILDKGWSVEYLPLDHGILCFGFRVIEPNIPGRLLIEKLSKYNIPNGPILGKLKKGETVILEDGTIINGNDFIDLPQKGRIVTILGDTRQTENAYKLALNANVLVHEATHGKNEGKLARRYFHSTNFQAAELAYKANVNLLLMNHISARYIGKDIENLEYDAQKIFENAYVAQDFSNYEILL